MRAIVHFLLAGCGARSDLSREARVGDASADVATERPSATCPTGAAPTPVLVAHLPIVPIPLDVGARTDAGELVTSIRGYVGGQLGYRVVAISPCGAVRDIVSAHLGAPMAFVVVRGDELFASDGIDVVYRLP
jgi:hypothetical protein